MTRLIARVWTGDARRLANLPADRFYPFSAGWHARIVCFVLDPSSGMRQLPRNVVQSGDVACQFVGQQLLVIPRAADAEPRRRIDASPDAAQREAVERRLSLLDDQVACTAIARDRAFEDRMLLVGRRLAF